MAYENTIGFDPTVKYQDTAGTYTNRPPFALGTRVRGRDGRDYIFARASAAVTASANVILTEPAMTVAAGAGSWTSPAVALALNEMGWMKKTAI